MLRNVQTVSDRYAPCGRHTIHVVWRMVTCSPWCWYRSGIRFTDTPWSCPDDRSQSAGRWAPSYQASLGCFPWGVQLSMVSVDRQSPIPPRPAGTGQSQLRSMLSGSFHLQTHCLAPAGLDIKGKWTLGGSLEGEPREAPELGPGRAKEWTVAKRRCGHALQHPHA